ncbi:iron reductase domain protein [Amniculicola lignicola CBS 123094]|uniref:Iron reductase domain protein n=1 Tax=Amniculicola lignicola CBS 123094 TaxID=1392246 RepID=A0A6A5WST3_9PLEO|nr:iron reductase domain protein [Amniculicola lignicola CBS 123094]
MMGRFAERVAVVGMLFGFWTQSVYAQSSSSPASSSPATPSATVAPSSTPTPIPASTFYLDKTETQFSVNIADNSSDVYIYFTSPAYSWVAVGFGENMKEALMLVMYLSSNGKNVTISPRLSSGHVEPSYAKDIQLETLPGTSISDEMFVLKAICRSCLVWPGSYIDVNSTAYPMIYAFGPGHSLQSNSPSAPLRRHVRYGKFSMDMKAAVGGPGGEGNVPAASKVGAGVVMQGGIKKDKDRMNRAHSVIGCLAVFVLWPINVVLAGFFRKIGIHVGFSGVLMAFLVVAYGLGIATSGQFNRSKAFTSPHQILAFLSLLPITLLSLLPIRPLARLHPKIPTLHMPLSTLTFITLILAGGMGLHLSSSPRPIITAYVCLALAVFVLLTLLQTCIKRRGSAYTRATTRRRLGEDDDQDMRLAEWWASRKTGDSSRSASSAANSPNNGDSNWGQPPPGNGNQAHAGGVEMGGHGRSGSAGSWRGNVYGAGTMPGPQYLLNMHPGVPVHKWS